jgi:hypothetical protein
VGHKIKKILGPIQQKYKLHLVKKIGIIFKTKICALINHAQTKDNQNL